MNDVANIIRRIEEEAELAVKETETSAGEEAEKVLASYRLQAEAVKDGIAKETEGKMNALRLRSQSQADITQRSMKLSYKRKAIEEAFQLALKKLSELDREQYINFLVMKIKESQREDAVLILNGRDKEAIGEELLRRVRESGGRNLTLADQTGNFSGGFILREGNIEINCTFEVLISAVREEVEGSAASVLFG